jgi:quercetin dioxygenase-like cupin family protein
MTGSGSDEGQRRPPPRVRFAGEEHLFDLTAEAEALASEPTGERHGHRQITLFREGTTSILLFDFGADGYLLDHAADGHVAIQVLSGELLVGAEGEEHTLPTGSLLVLRPNVRHDVRARTASRMLLTVHLV